MKTSFKLCGGLVFLSVTLWACTDQLFVFAGSAVTADGAKVGQTFLVKIPVFSTMYNGSNGNGPVTFSVSSSGTFKAAAITANVTLGDGSMGTMVITGMATVSGPNTGTFTINSFCGTFQGIPSTIPYTITAIAPTAPLTAAQISNQGFVSEPVATFTGELFGGEKHLHLRQSGPIPFGIQPHYASYLAANNIASALGPNWMHNYDVKLAVSGSSATVTLYQGKTVTFTKSNNAFSLSSTERSPYQLIAAGANFQFLSPVTQLIYTFNSSGALTGIQDRSGNTLTVTQGSLGPTQVSDGLGRTLTFTYTGPNLTKVQDQAGRSIVIDYTSGNLSGFTDENGKRTAYAYTSAGTLTALMTGETRPAGNQSFTQTFDTQGRVSKQSDSAANAMTVTYNANNTVLSEPQGVTLTDTHDTNANLTSTSWAAGNPSQYTYDSKNRKTGSTDRTGAKRSVAYDPASGLPSSVTDEFGNTTSFGYASSTQSGFTFYDLSGITLADGSTIAIARDSKGRISSLTDENGKTSQATWNDRGQVLTSTNASGGVTTFTYGNDGSLSTVQTPSGDTTKLAYDNAGNPNLFTNPDNTTRAKQFDSAGNITRTTDERGNSFAANYDGNNNLIGTTDALGGATVIAYDGNDRVRSITDPAGKTSRQTFDANSRLATVTDPTGVALTYGYNTQNQLTSVTDAAGKATNLTNDGESRFTSSTDALNRTTALGRDARGQMTSLTTPNNEKYTIAYDTLGRPISVTDPTSAVTQYRYDKRGGLIGVTHPGGVVESFQRNELGLVTTLTRPDGNSWQRTYDSSGRLVSIANPLGNSVTYTYNSRQQVASAKSDLGTGTYTYDAAGNLTSASYSDGTVLNYSYDALNRLTAADSVAITYDAAGRIAKYNGFSFTYDDAGRLASINYGPGQTATYTYNNLGLLAQVQDWAGGKTVFTYDAAHQLTSKTFANGMREDFTYDSNGRALTLTVTQGSQTILSETVKRDSLGRITSDNISGITIPDPGPYVSQQFDAAEHSYAAQYDALGRVIQDSLRTYKWDLAGRLLSYTGVTGSATFTYDGLGNVISRTSSPGTAAQSIREEGKVVSILPVGNLTLTSDTTSEVPGEDGRPVSFVQNGVSIPVIFDIGGSFIAALGAGGGTLVTPPGGGPAVVSGTMPISIGEGIFDTNAGLLIDLPAVVYDQNSGRYLVNTLPQFAAAVPSLSILKRAAERSSARNNLRQLALAIHNTPKGPLPLAEGFYAPADLLQRLRDIGNLNVAVLPTDPNSVVFGDGPFDPGFLAGAPDIRLTGAAAVTNPFGGLPFAPGLANAPSGQYIQLYTGISLNYRFLATASVHTYEEEEDRANPVVPRRRVIRTGNDLEPPPEMPPPAPEAVD
jgi:YD repeat-containing protein